MGKSKKGKKNGKRSRHPLVRRLVTFAVRVTILLVIGTVVIVLPWRWFPPPTTAFVAREWIFGSNPIERRWVPMREISPNLAIAAVAAEDQKFPNHYGFDLVAIAEALERNRRGGEDSGVRGGSTISQQVAKNLYLWPAQSWVRKGAEAWLTLWIELLWPKRRILEMYLNVAEFGPGIFGADAASERAFGKPPSELSLREAAILVAVLPSPRRMSITDPSDYVRERAGQIVEAVGALGGPGYIDGL